MALGPCFGFKELVKKRDPSWCLFIVIQFNIYYFIFCYQISFLVASSTTGVCSRKNYGCNPLQSTSFISSTLTVPYLRLKSVSIKLSWFSSYYFICLWRIGSVILKRIVPHCSKSCTNDWIHFFITFCYHHVSANPFYGLL